MTVSYLPYFDEYGGEVFPEEAEPSYVAPEPPAETYPLAIPSDAMYGYLREMAAKLQGPLGWGYCSLLTLITAQGCCPGESRVRGTLYTALIGDAGDGKSRTIKRAREALRISPEHIRKITPGSDRGLQKMFGSNSKTKEVPELKSWCLTLDELRDMMQKMDVPGSSLPMTLCSLWSEDDGGSADKTGTHEVNIRLSILGALKVSDTGEFARLYGSATQGGYYDRCVFVPGPPAEVPWEFDDEWEVPKIGEYSRVCSHTTIPSRCWAMLKEWRKEAPEGIQRKRMGEIVMRVALISAAANHDATITEECMTAALAFGEWQERVRQVYRAGVAENKDAECASLILDALAAAGKDDDGRPAIVKLHRIATQKNWYRKFGPVFSRVLKNLHENNGPVIAFYRKKADGSENDYTRPNGSYRLRDEEVDDD